MSVPNGCPRSQKRASYVLELDTHVVQVILLAQAFKEVWEVMDCPAVLVGWLVGLVLEVRFVGSVSL